MFNLTVSNIPGPREPMYMLGCELEEAYPVVPLADEHALSIGMTTVKDRACFGLYADREALPDADRPRRRSSLHRRAARPRYLDEQDLGVLR